MARPRPDFHQYHRKRRAMSIIPHAPWRTRATNGASDSNPAMTPIDPWAPVPHPLGMLNTVVAIG